MVNTTDYLVNTVPSRTLRVISM